MIKRVLIVLIGITVLNGCNENPSKKIPSTTSDSKKCCSPDENLIGRNYLDNKILEEVRKIKTSEEMNASIEGMVLIRGGEFDMGGDFPNDYKNMPKEAVPQPDELPKHKVLVSDFYMDEHEVTVGEFMKFVEETGYKTVAEKDIEWEEIKKQLPANTPKPDEEVLKAGALVFQLVDQSVTNDDLSNWWNFVKGANWKNPDGNLISIDSILNFPVTQVSWYDALAYAKWAGKRLPTEAEFEYAMRGGKQYTVYPWGNEKLVGSDKRGNFLQGNFPYSNTADDGFEGVSPVKSFPANGYGLYDIAGNVWEWTSDWYGANYYDILSKMKRISKNPKGPEKTVEVYNPKAINKVVRGGSFLCNDNWCSGYRNSRRMRLSPDSGMQHLGFRLVKNIKK